MTEIPEEYPTDSLWEALSAEARVSARVDMVQARRLLELAKLAKKLEENAYTDEDDEDDAEVIVSFEELKEAVEDFSAYAKTIAEAADRMLSEKLAEMAAISNVSLKRESCESCESCESLKHRLESLKLAQLTMADLYDNVSKELLDQTNQRAALERDNERLRADLEEAQVLAASEKEDLLKAKEAAETETARVTSVSRKLLASYQELKARKDG